MEKITLTISLLLLMNLTNGQTNNCNLPDSVINSLKVTLEKVYEDDQFISGGSNHLNFDSNSTQKPLIRIDSMLERNFTIVSDILKTYGWPPMECVGATASMTIYLVLHHANMPIKERRKYLSIMRTAVKQGKISKVYLAYFEDRTLIESGKKQKYGTQVKSIYRNGMSSKPELQAVENPRNLNKRRKKMGLNTIEEYLKESFDIIYEPRK
jgi:hypothetical protein